MKEKKSHFTNEELARKFKSNFDLVNYAIKLAENMIRTGRDARVKSDIQNRAMLVLEEIAEGKDRFDEIKEPVIDQKNVAVFSNGQELKAEAVYQEERGHERRRAKVILSDQLDE